MNEYYNNFFQHISPDKYQTYLQFLQLKTGENYKFASTPFFIHRSQYDRLKKITQATVKLLQDTSYQKTVYDVPWFLPQYPMQEQDYFGCVDFHLQPDSEKIIEINLFAPGFSSFMELVEKQFFQTFNCFGNPTASDFEEKLVSALTNNFEHKRVAIVDIDAYNQYNIDEFRYVKKLLAKHNVESSIVPAENVAISKAGNLLYEGNEYARIFNRLISYDWQQHADRLTNYSALYQKNPEMFFTNPFGWQLGDKRILPVMYNLDRQSFNLNRDDVELLSAAVLNTKLLQTFSDLDECIEEFGLPRHVIVKPLDNYAGRGILYKPSNKKLKEIIETDKENYIIQEIFPPGKIPYMKPDGSKTEAKFDVRIVFMNTEVVGAYARSYQGSITNFSRDVGGLTPVIVV
jgi:hypothetical protein